MPAHRLANLLELANRGPAMREALAEEVAELLADWPSDCPPEMRFACEALLARTRREAHGGGKAQSSQEPQEPVLVEAARRGEAVAPRLARALGISESLALGILCDESGHCLAVAAKALGLDRAAFSSLALLSCPVGDEASCYERLQAFDAVSEAEARRELARWSGAAHAA